MTQESLTKFYRKNGKFFVEIPESIIMGAIREMIYDNDSMSIKKGAKNTLLDMILEKWSDKELYAQEEPDCILDGLESVIDDLFDDHLPEIFNYKDSEDNG